MFNSSTRKIRAAADDAARHGAGGSAGAGSQLDAGALAALRQLDPDGSRGFVAQVLSTYLKSLERHLDELRPLRDPQSLRRVGEVAHMLKSSSASVGALAFSRQCAEVEALARGGDAGALGAPLTALVEEGARVVQAVRAMLPG
jgi:HPt (histidine-containing phosphotransfer) domain-containing protein